MTANRTPGQRAGLSRGLVLDAALAVADREGVRALTMRRLGQELGVEAMTVYHYVPSKDALLDGLVERVLAAAVPAARASGDWQGMLRDYAGALRAALLRHPGVLPLVAVRPAVTPATLDAVERVLTALTAAGFALGGALDMVNTLTLFTVGHATAEAAHAGTADGVGSAAWLAALEQDRYPLLVEAARRRAGTDDETRFRYAIEALLTGFAAESS
ncbi:TetR/AcrR family transcriptional regulator C-terminal domain-containing protein [Streptomyces sp. URMC 123]|uniref:TetR/AcrR family transcriptional regulator C-terminal domain-containing protein n=1 Tax=Streptomyces sp. URMC 123 TaxID=3423403 RepID=UPI003F1C71FB